MLVPHLLKIYLTLVSSNDIMTIKNNTKKNVKNHKKINKQKRFLKEKEVGCQMTKGKRTQIMRWEKDNLQIFTFIQLFSKYRLN